MKIHIYTNQMILNIDEIVCLVSRHIALEPGDIIFTGSPAGARDSIVKKNDIVSHKIEHLGELKFYIN